MKTIKWERIGSGIWKKYEKGCVRATALGPSYHGKKEWVLYVGVLAIRTTHPTLRAAKKAANAWAKNRN